MYHRSLKAAEGGSTRKKKPKTARPSLSSDLFRQPSESEPTSHSHLGVIPSKSTATSLPDSTAPDSTKAIPSESEPTFHSHLRVIPSESTATSLPDSTAPDSTKATPSDSTAIFLSGEDEEIPFQDLSGAISLPGKDKIIPFLGQSLTSSSQHLNEIFPLPDPSSSSSSKSSSPSSSGSGPGSSATSKSPATNPTGSPQKRRTQNDTILLEEPPFEADHATTPEENRFFNAVQRTQGRNFFNWYVLSYELNRPNSAQPTLGHGSKFKYRLAINNVSSTNWLSPPDDEQDENNERVRADDIDKYGEAEPIDYSYRRNFSLWKSHKTVENPETGDTHKTVENPETGDTYKTSENLDTTDTQDDIELGYIKDEDNPMLDDKVGDFVGYQLGFVQYANAQDKEPATWHPTNIPVALQGFSAPDSDSPLKYVSKGKQGLSILNPAVYKLFAKCQINFGPAPDDVLEDLDLINYAWIGIPYLGRENKLEHCKKLDGYQYSAWPVHVTETGTWRIRYDIIEQDSTE